MGLIKSLSRITKLDLSYFIKESIWLTISKGFNLFKALIISIILANLLPEEVFGQYKFITTTLATVGVFSLIAFKDYIVAAIISKKEQTIIQMIKLQLKWGLLGSLALLSIAIFGLATGRNYGMVVFIILAFCNPLFHIVNNFKYIQSGKKQFNKLAIWSIASDISAIVALGITIIFSQHIIAIILAWMIPQIIVEGLATYFAINNLNKSSVDKKLIAKGKKLSLPYAINNLAINIDILIMPFFLSFADIAIYAIITLLPNQIKFIANSYVPLFLPKLAEHKKITQKEVLNLGWKLLVPVIILIILYVAISPIIFTYVYPTYADYVHLSILFSISLISFPYVLYKANFIRLQKIKEVTRISYISTTYLIIGTFILIPALGLIGAVINRIIFRALLLALYIHYTKHTLAEQ